MSSLDELNGKRSQEIIAALPEDDREEITFYIKRNVERAKDTLKTEDKVFIGGVIGGVIGITITCIWFCSGFFNYKHMEEEIELKQKEIDATVEERVALIVGQERAQAAIDKEKYNTHVKEMQAWIDSLRSTNEELQAVKNVLTTYCSGGE